MADVLVIGMAGLDFVFSLETMPRRARKYRAKAADIVGGGPAATAAVTVQRLGGTAILAAQLGDDIVGDLIMGGLLSEGVDTALIERTTGVRSAFSSVYLDGKGERQVVNFPGDAPNREVCAVDLLTGQPEVDAVLADTRWTAAAIHGLKMARVWGVPGVLDAEAPVDPTVMRQASHVAFSRTGLLSLSDSPDLAGSLEKVAVAADAWACVTDGENGVTYAGPGGTGHVPAFPVPIADTLGAGDVWHGAFTLSLAEGASERDAIVFANAAAAIKCTQPGGRAGCPDRGAVHKFLGERTRCN